MTPLGWLRLSKSPHQSPVRPRFRPILELLEDRCVPATFLVNTTVDTPALNLLTGQDAEGNISLRSALEAANFQAAPAGGHLIQFAIGNQGTPATIHIGSGTMTPLPEITQQMTIDGWSQGGAGYTGPPLIKLDGELLGQGAFTPVGLDIRANYVVVRGLTIVDFNSLGGGVGIALRSETTGAWIYGNYIGFDLNSEVNESNYTAGIFIDTGADGHSIGTNADGTNDSAERNVISGNVQDGIRVFGSSNTIAGNYIGVLPDGVSMASNYGAGILINGGRNNLIGGVAPGQGNLIAFNGLASTGVHVVAGTGNSIRGNSIRDNVGLGIDLGTGALEGLTANDSGDSDDGPNNLQNFPELQAVYQQGNTLEITFSVDATAGSLPGQSTYPLDIDFYLADSDGQEGRTYLGSTLWTSADIGQFKTVTLASPVSLTGSDRILATATDAAGNTSEFSLSRGINSSTLGLSLSLDSSQIQEGGAVTLTVDFSDPTSDQQHQVDVDWGDGQQQHIVLEPGINQHLFFHTYSNNLPFVPDRIKVRVSNNLGQQVRGSIGLEVSNVVPAVNTAPEFFIGQGNAAIGQGQIVDPGNDTWTVTINWGDGAQPEQFVTTTRTFPLNHFYQLQGQAIEGTFTVTIVVTDGGEGAQPVQPMVHVLPEPPLATDSTTGTDSVIHAEIPQVIAATLTRTTNPGTEVTLIVALLPNHTADDATSETAIFLFGPAGEEQRLMTYDVRIVGGVVGDVLQVEFIVPFQGDVTPVLEYLDVASNTLRPVEGSSTIPTQVIYDPAQGTWHFLVTLDQTSLPRVLDLFGSVFTVSVPQLRPVPPTPTTVPASSSPLGGLLTTPPIADLLRQNAVAVQAGAGTGVLGGIATTGFSGGLQLQSAVSSSQLLTLNPNRLLPGTDNEPLRSDVVSAALRWLEDIHSWFWNMPEPVVTPTEKKPAGDAPIQPGDCGRLGEPLTPAPPTQETNSAIVLVIPAQPSVTTPATEPQKLPVEQEGKNRLLLLLLFMLLSGLPLARRKKLRRLRCSFPAPVRCQLLRNRRKKPREVASAAPGSMGVRVLRRQRFT